VRVKSMIGGIITCYPTLWRKIQDSKIKRLLLLAHLQKAWVTTLSMTVYSFQLLISLKVPQVPPIFDGNLPLLCSNILRRIRTRSFVHNARSISAKSRENGTSQCVLKLLTNHLDWLEVAQARPRFNSRLTAGAPSLEIVKVTQILKIGSK
jgi:hypothetical protein